MAAGSRPDGNGYRAGASNPGDPRVIAIFGPTGIGKTEAAIELGRELGRCSGGAVAINCDSMQVYSGIGLLAGAPRDDQLDELEHRLVGFVPLDSEFSAGEFQDVARTEIDAVLDEGRWPIVVGGTGLYMRAALAKLELQPRISDELEAEVASEIDTLGLATVHGSLPPDLAASVHPNDRKRILRYTALLRAGHHPSPTTSGGGELWSASLRRPTETFGLTLDRKELAERIRERVRKMAETGAVEEARKALSKNPSRTASKAIGLNEFASGDLEGASRRHLAFARRQQAWLKRMEGVTLIDRGRLSDREVAVQMLETLALGADRQA